LEFHLATVTSVIPKTGNLEDWNAAYYRLEDYLRAHHLVSKVHQTQVITQILARASLRHAQTPNITPIQLAMEEAYKVITEWFQRVLQNPDIPPERLPMIGNVGMLAIDAHGRWPNIFLSQTELPEDFARQLQQAMVRSGPDLRVSSMVPREADGSSGAEKLTQNRRGGGAYFCLLAGVGALLGAGILIFLRY
jgi:hypothetical protein